MPENSLALEVEVQQVLDELWDRKEIPFALNVGKITEGASEYTVHFHDARMRTVGVQLGDNHPLRERVRTAVLERVAKMSGSLKHWHNPPTD